MREVAQQREHLVQPGCGGLARSGKYGFQVVDHQQHPPLRQDTLHGETSPAELLLGRANPLFFGDRVARDELAAQALQEEPRAGQVLDAREGDALEAAEVQEPAGTLDGEGGLSLAPFAEHG